MWPPTSPEEHRHSCDFLSPVHGKLYKTLSHSLRSQEKKGCSRQSVAPCVHFFVDDGQLSWRDSRSAMQGSHLAAG